MPVDRNEQELRVGDAVLIPGRILKIVRTDGKFQDIVVETDEAMPPYRPISRAKIGKKGERFAHGQPSPYTEIGVNGRQCQKVTEVQVHGEIIVGPPADKP